MQSKYRKLYLYASNTQNITKKPSETIDQYKLNKQKSIEHLKKLLDIQIGLPPVAQFLTFNSLDKNTSNQSNLLNQANQTITKILKPKIKLNTLVHKQSFLPSTSRLINIQRNAFNSSINEQIKIRNKIKQEEKEKLYQKYINQYMEKIQRDNVLEKYPEADYTKLVQDACNQIRNKINRQQHLILQVEKSLEQSNDHQNLSKLKQKKKKKANSLQQIRNKSPSQQKIHNNSLSKLMTSKLFLIKSHQKRSKSLAQHNLYRLNLQQIQKINEIKLKVRKRSEKQFVRNITKYSHYQSFGFPRIQ